MDANSYARWTQIMTEKALIGFEGYLPVYWPLCPWAAKGFLGIFSSRFAVR